jgi:hypothetical protein
MCPCAGAYRERLILLDEYSATHDIPQSMIHELKGHLQLHFSSSEMSDEAVLGVYPTTVRRCVGVDVLHLCLMEFYLGVAGWNVCTCMVCVC